MKLHTLIGAFVALALAACGGAAEQETEAQAPSPAGQVATAEPSAQEPDVVEAEAEPEPDLPPIDVPPPPDPGGGQVFASQPDDGWIVSFAGFDAEARFADLSDGIVRLDADATHVEFGVGGPLPAGHSTTVRLRFATGELDDRGYGVERHAVLSDSAGSWGLATHGYNEDPVPCTSATVVHDEGAGTFELSIPSACLSLPAGWDSPTESPQGGFSVQLDAQDEAGEWFWADYLSGSTYQSPVEGASFADGSAIPTTRSYFAEADFAKIAWVHIQPGEVVTVTVQYHARMPRGHVADLQIGIAARTDDEIAVVSNVLGGEDFLRLKSPADPYNPVECAGSAVRSLPDLGQVEFDLPWSCIETDLAYPTTWNSTVTDEAGQTWKDKLNIVDAQTNSFVQWLGPDRPLPQWVDPEGASHH